MQGLFRIFCHCNCPKYEEKDAFSNLSSYSGKTRDLECALANIMYLCSMDEFKKCWKSKPDGSRRKAGGMQRGLVLEMIRGNKEEFVRETKPSVLCLETKDFETKPS